MNNDYFGSNSQKVHGGRERISVYAQMHWAQEMAGT
jgi:hypothetical protein